MICSPAAASAAFGPHHFREHVDSGSARPRTCPSADSGGLSLARSEGDRSHVPGRFRGCCCTGRAARPSRPRRRGCSRRTNGLGSTAAETARRTTPSTPSYSPPGCGCRTGYASTNAPAPTSPAAPPKACLVGRSSAVCNAPRRPRVGRRAVRNRLASVRLVR